MNKALYGSFKHGCHVAIERAECGFRQDCTNNISRTVLARLYGDIHDALYGGTIGGVHSGCFNCYPRTHKLR